MQRISKEKHTNIDKKRQRGKDSKYIIRKKIIWSSIWKLVRFIEYWNLSKFLKALLFQRYL